MSDLTCSIGGCERPRVVRQWCRAHYNRWRQTRKVGPAKIRRRREGGAECEYPDCGRPHEAHGLCPGHLHQKKMGIPLAPIMARLKTTDRDEHGRKLCRLCRGWLPVESFYINSIPKDGLHNRCMRCHRSEQLVRSYGITMDEYERMLEEQGGACRICKRTNENGRELSVDHDHSCCPGRTSCGRCVRGLLCNRCNIGLGYFREDIACLRAAAEYLSKGGRRS